MQVNQRLTLNLQHAFGLYLMYNNTLDSQIVRECYFLLAIKEDLIIENPVKLLDNSTIFPNLLNMYLLATAPSNILPINVMQIIENLSNRELKRYRIDVRTIREWLLPSGLQKYQFNFIKIFCSEFISYNELNLLRCLNVKLKSKQQSLLHCIKDFSNRV